MMCFLSVLKPKYKAKEHVESGMTQLKILGRFSANELTVISGQSAAEIITL